MESCKATRWKCDCLLLLNYCCAQRMLLSAVTPVWLPGMSPIKSTDDLAWRAHGRCSLMQVCNYDIELKRNVARLTMRTTSSQHMLSRPVLPFCPFWLHTLICLNSPGLCFRVYVRRSQGAGTDPAKDSMPRASLSFHFMHLLSSAIHTNLLAQSSLEIKPTCGKE